MRILLLTQFFDPEPAAIPGMPLAGWLAGRGHDVEVLTGFPNYPGGQPYPDHPVRPLRRERYDNVRITRVPLYPSHDRSALRRIANYSSFALSATTIGSVVTRRPDVVYAYHPPATVGLPALAWKALWAAPYLYHVQDMWPESVVDSGMVRPGALSQAVERSIDWWCRLVYRGAGALAVLSPGFKRLLVERGVDAGKIHVVPNWAQEELFYPRGRNEDLAKELGLAGQVNIVYAGNMGSFQNLDVAIRAAHRVRHLERFRLVFIGNGQAHGDLERLAGSLHADNVRFLGLRAFREMGAIANLADALLVSLKDLPFFAATIPGKTQAALAAGRPIVMAVRGDAADLVREAEAGMTVTPGDEAGLASAFQRMYALSSVERDAMGMRGRAYYQSQLALDRGAGRLEELLMALGSR